MRMMNETLKNSRKNLNNPPYPDHRRKKEPGLYTSMFFQDFCKSFSITLGQINDRESFYRVEAPDKKLESLLNYRDYRFLEDRLDDIFSQNLADLIECGKAFVEVVRWYDKDERLVGISLEPFRSTKRIQDEDVIVLNLKDFGYSKGYFKRLFKKLDKIKMPSLSLTLGKNNGFDFDVFTRRNEFRLLEAGHDVRWLGRNYTNYYINEPYLLYFRMKELMLKEKILGILLEKYNAKLKEVGSKYGFEGQICFSSRTSGYDELFSELSQGQKNCQQVADVIYRF